MKLLLIHFAGLHPYQKCTFKHFVNDGVEVSLIVPIKIVSDHVASNTELVLDAPIMQDDYHVIPVPLKDERRPGLGFNFVELAKVIYAINPDIIHVFDEATSRTLMQVIVLCRIRKLSAHIVCYCFENIKRKLKLHKRLVYNYLWRSMSGATGSSCEALETIRYMGFPSDRQFEAIFRGVCIDMFQPADKQAARKAFSLPDGFIVGTAGRFVPEKGFSVLFNALRKTPREISCVIAGDGPLRDDLMNTAKLPELQGRVVFAGKISFEKMAEFVNCCDVFVVPSLTVPHWKEQFGNVIAESMACGVPVIGSDSGAIPEVIGDAGVVVPEDDVNALVDAITMLFHDQQKRLGFRKRGLARAKEVMGMDVFARRHLDFYHRLLAK